MPDSDPSKRLAAALGRVPSGLYILTARHGDAETGMLVSWVQQCSFAPPLVSACHERVNSARFVTRRRDGGFSE